MKNNKILGPKHRHQLDREIHKSLVAYSEYEGWAKYHATYIWSCKKCPYLKKKEVFYHE